MGVAAVLGAGVVALELAMRTKSFGKAVGGEESSVRAHSYLAYRVEVGAGARGDRDSIVCV